MSKDVSDIKIDTQGRVKMTYWKQDSFDMSKIHIVSRIFDSNGD